MKHYFVLFLTAAAVCSPFSVVEAKTISNLPKTVEQPQSQINQLQNKSATLGAGSKINPYLEITSFDDKKEGQPKIKITGPTRKKSIFNKANIADPILISWIAYNVPENTNLIIDLNNVKVKGTVGGGSAQFELPKGDSTGSYKWDIYEEGQASVGTYRVQLGLEECSSQGCNVNAHFPGQEEDVELYVQSKSVGVSVIGKATKALATKMASIITVDDTDTENPTITGIANSGITEVSFSIDQGDKVYGRGLISVTNKRWSHTVTEDLKPGTYTLTLYVNNAVANTKTFKVKR